MSHLFSALEELNSRKLPPVRHWNPPYCGEIDLRIMKNGVWLYENSQIKRDRLVKLLASILRLDNDGKYYLVTPSEKLGIRVDDAPFLGIEFSADGYEKNQRLAFRTNVDDTVLVDANHPIRVVETIDTGEPSPYVMVRDGLEARLSRTVFYQLADLAIEQNQLRDNAIGIWSCGTFFYLENKRF
ncbi:MAG: proteophosphoglycan precursor [Acidiferrobacteraceae bacterium]|nr:proteophosphoglycan precursor [Acidiferrobacteraceae bacterium]|tara:strand:+ start:37 stop:591 length:555 start_codon:yes stop_codon:yes gene_type:complete